MDVHACLPSYECTPHLQRNCHRLWLTAYKGLTSPSGLESLGVVLYVVLDERGDEEVGVVVAPLEAQGERHAGLRAGSLEVLRQQLLLDVELVGVTLTMN